MSLMSTYTSLHLKVSYVSCSGFYHAEYLEHKPAQTSLQLSVAAQLQSINSRLQQLFVTQTCRETA